MRLLVKNQAKYAGLHLSISATVFAVLGVMCDDGIKFISASMVLGNMSGIVIQAKLK